MLSLYFRLIFCIFFVLSCAVFCFGQSSNDLPETLRENLAKRRIKEEEKEYSELIKRSEEAAKLSEEISKSYEEHNKLLESDQKKIEKLEKVVKRIRRDLGAEDFNEKEEEEKPATVLRTLNIIKEKTSSLLTELKKASRYSISVVAVESSNSVFNLIKFLKFNKD